MCKVLELEYINEFITNFVVSTCDKKPFAIKGVVHVKLLGENR